MPVSFDLGVQVIVPCFVSLWLKVIRGERELRDCLSQQVHFTAKETEAQRWERTSSKPHNLCF